ncbi:MAG: DUF2520 domain-containing protein [Bacteroidales bacterium]|nr:DUF2520 domain-containing protein [Bacteroidales bacterium]
MIISFIGSGNVATHLAQAFQQAGHTIRQIMSREYDHAKTLAAKVSASPIDTLGQLDLTADMFVLAVSDDSLYDLALDLKTERKIVVHTSGSVPMQILKGISRHHGVIYAPQTFVKNVEMDYSHLPFCIEASDPITFKKLEGLASSVSDKTYSLNSDQRRVLHLASVMVNNFGNALNAIAQETLNKEEIPFEILHPLIEMTTQKIYQGNLWKLQTGPAVRRDQKTINAHRRMIADNPDLLSLYDLMTKLIDHATH